MQILPPKKSPNVKRPIHPTVLTPIPGARHDKITPLSGASKTREPDEINEHDRESTNEIESRFIEQDRAESHQTRPSRDSSNETRRVSMNEITWTRTRDTP